MPVILVGLILAGRTGGVRRWQGGAGDLAGLGPVSLVRWLAGDVSLLEAGRFGAG
jgi:hypothetical protein